MRQSHETNRPEDAFWMNGPRKEEPGVQTGCLIGLLAHGTAILLLLITAFLLTPSFNRPARFNWAVLPALGLFQIFYLWPLDRWARRLGYSNQFRRGLILAAAILFLLMVPCSSQGFFMEPIP
ncbi:MAG: hypothetical protein KDB61_05965 [Planctomycetes bacterium]|nr:hypothetical protein [Planctomycetota bacterium]